MSIKNHSGTYVNHRVRLKLRDGAVIFGRFLSGDSRSVVIRGEDGNKIKVLRRALRTLAVIQKGTQRTEGARTCEDSSTSPSLS